MRLAAELRDRARVRVEAAREEDKQEQELLEREMKGRRLQVLRLAGKVVARRAQHAAGLPDGPVFNESASANRSCVFLVFSPFF